jgi:hypothetical protein
MRQLKLMQIGFQLQMTRIAFACIDRTVNKSLTLQVVMAIIIDASFVLHINRRRASGGDKQQNNKIAKNTMHNSAHPTIDEKLYFISEQQRCALPAK